MAHVTFQILDGLERGEILRDLPTPLSIGREEDNQIRLNDERVSRFHAKVQEDDGRIILTDLESTNGTRVNGHAVKMRVLQVGDQVLIGRCLLLYGSPEEIAARARNGSRHPQWPQGDQTVAARSDSDIQDEPPFASESDLLEDPFPQGPPELPQNLSAVQAAQLSDLCSYIHSRVLRVLLAAEEDVGTARGDVRERMLVSLEAWHELQELQMQLSTYLKGIADPTAGNS
jgi:predicted component of type VI protein secretion system